MWHLELQRWGLTLSEFSANTAKCWRSSVCLPPTQAVPLVVRKMQVGEHCGHAQVLAERLILILILNLPFVVAGLGVGSCCLSQAVTSSPILCRSHVAAAPELRASHSAALSPVYLYFSVYVALSLTCWHRKCSHTGPCQLASEAAWSQFSANADKPPWRLDGCYSVQEAK